jgi:hypothetical protein
MENEQAMPTESAAAGRFMGVLEQDGLLVIALGAFAMVIVLSLRKDLVVDGWMALMSGRWVVQHGLPTHDHLALWTHGRRWIDQQWLAQITLYGLVRLGGLKLVLLVHALLVTSAIAGAALIARIRGATARAVVWVTIPAMVAYYPVATVLRPQTFAFPLFVATLWLLIADQRNPSRRVFFVLPILALWGNLHGSVLLGAMLVSLAGLVGMWERRRPTPRGVALLLAPWACVFVSPYALHLPAYYEKILVSGDFSKFVSEWAPTTLKATTAPVYLIVLAGLWLLGRWGRDVTLFEKLAFVVTGVVAFQAIRDIAWVGLVAIAVLPQLVDRIRQQPAEEPRRLNRILSIVILATVVISVAGVAAKPTIWFTSGFPDAGAKAVAAAAGPQGKVFATSPYADWLLWSRPQLAGRVAFDSRFELLTSAQVRHLTYFEARAGDWLAQARRYRVFVVSRRTDRTFARALVRQLPARIVFSSRQVEVLRRLG